MGRDGMGWDGMPRLLAFACCRWVQLPSENKPPKKALLLVGGGGRRREVRDAVRNTAAKVRYLLNLLQLSN